MRTSSPFIAHLASSSSSPSSSSRRCRLVHHPARPQPTPAGDPALPNPARIPAPAAGHRPTAHLALPGRRRSRTASPSAAGQTVAAASPSAPHLLPSRSGEHPWPRTPNPNPKTLTLTHRHLNHHPGWRRPRRPAAPPTSHPVAVATCRGGNVRVREGEGQEREGGRLGFEIRRM
jgi:hypothetical protein